VCYTDQRNFPHEAEVDRCSEAKNKPKIDLVDINDRLAIQFCVNLIGSSDCWSVYRQFDMIQFDFNGSRSTCARGSSIYDVRTERKGVQSTVNACGQGKGWYTQVWTFTDNFKS
jgi:hypothetical protein